MRAFPIILALLALFVPVGQAMAQADDALAYQTVEPARIKLGESAILRVTSFGRLKEISLPSVPGLIFENLGRSQGLEFVGGTAVPATFVQVRVTAQFAGVFTIPGLMPSLHAIGLEVVKGDEPNPYAWHSQQPAPPPVVTAVLPKGTALQAGGAAFVHLAIPRRDVYVGESVPVDIELGLRAGIVTSLRGLPTLKGSDFTLNNLSKQPERREQAIDGSTFIVLTWHSVVAAVKPGEFPLSVETPLTAKISALSAADRAVASRLAFPLLQNMYSGVAPKEITIDSPPSELRVLPLPAEGQPKDFSGAVGDFQVSSDISPVEVAAGDPLTLRLHVSGSGNFDRVDATMLDHLDHWKTYPAKSAFTPSDTIGYEGEKVFEQPLIAAQPGEQSIPGLAFSYFNPTTRRYQRAQTPSIKVTVLDSLAGASLRGLNADPSLQAAHTTPSIQGLRPDHPHAQDTASDLRPLYFRASFLTIPTTLALILAGGWFAVRPHAARASTQAAERALARLNALARAGDDSSFFELARQTLLQTFAARWQMPADQITAAELRARLGAHGEDVERLFALADEAKYAGHRPDVTDFPRWLALLRAQLAGESSSRHAAVMVLLIAGLSLWAGQARAQPGQTLYSADGLYNLGNSYARAGKPGLAVLSYERAALLAPDDPDIQANLDYVRASAQLPVKPRSRLMRLARLTRPGLAAWLGVLGLVLVGTGMVVRRLTRRRLWIPGSVIVLGVALLSLTASSARLLWPRMHEAIVLVDQTPARVTPAPMGDTAFLLREADSVTMLAEHEDFMLIRTDGGLSGWVARANLGAVVPSTAADQP